MSKKTLMDLLYSHAANMTIHYHPEMARPFNCLSTGLFLSQIIFHDPEADADGWVPYKFEQWQKEIQVDEKKQKYIRRKLKDLKVIEEISREAGQIYCRINDAVLFALWKNSEPEEIKESIMQLSDEKKSKVFRLTFDVNIMFGYPYSKLVGGALAGLFLYTAYKQTDETIDDGWVQYTPEQWERKTGMNPEERESSSLKLQELGLLEEKRQDGILYYRIDIDRLTELLGESK